MSVSTLHEMISHDRRFVRETVRIVVSKDWARDSYCHGFRVEGKEDGEKTK